MKRFIRQKKLDRGSSSRGILFKWFFGALLAVLICPQAFPAQTIKIVNNQPFPVRLPVVVKGANLQGEKWRAAGGGGAAVQKDGEDLIFVADLPASQAESLKLEKAPAKGVNKPFVLSPSNGGAALKFAGAELGQLSWDIIFRDSKPEELKGEPVSTKEDFSARFEPLSLRFEKVSAGAVFDLWRARGEEKGLQLTVELRAYHDGFLDIDAELKNTSAEKTRGVYAAVLTRWRQANQAARAVCYDNRIAAFGENDWTLFRAGESRNWYVQHGVDWLKTDFGGKVSATWMNDFSQSFTVHQDANAKRRGRFVGANIPQIGFEAQSKAADLFLLTEIARSNLKSYAERLEDNRLMERGESVVFRSRLAFNQNLQTDEQADNAFVAYTSYAEQKISGDELQYSIGVADTRFGTNYFPYSTLGENFDLQKLPGMDRDGYWALAADTVNKWQLFADDIRRDLRIAKTLGYELIRLHHLEIIYADTISKEKRFEYLDFLFGELRKLKFKVLIDARLSADETAELVRRYRADLDGVEIDNEVLIFGVNDDAPEYWKRVYRAVKQAAPEIPVHLTAHTNTGIFDRLQKLGVPFDKIGQHAYSDGLDSQPNMRGFSLAAASYGRRAGKPPIITEWNWRFLTRLTEDDRARIYAPIFENVLRTRSMPVMYQFQFNETLAMNPRVLKGIRHYEQIWLSRRPKPEAFVMADLIKKYSAPEHPNRLLNIEHETVELDKRGRGMVNFKITNTGNRELNLKSSVETPANLFADSAMPKESVLRLRPNETKTISVSIEAALSEDFDAPVPGFYHVFLRLEDGALLRYGWAEARLAGAPKFDAATKTNVVYGDGALDFSLNRPLAVVYGDKSPIQDVETAYAVVNALESATGRVVKIYALKDLPKDDRAALILIGTAKTNPLIADVAKNLAASVLSAKQFVATAADKNRLILSGADNLEAERAAMDWTLRFWKYAKDSAARRVGLAEKELPLGADPAQLP
ncbi:MAG TPA: hypothetical protein VGC97_24715 [Pyrinomonadaceae bacterium]|jgi:hypothetical protein